jgi:hypothetical protein
MGEEFAFQYFIKSVRRGSPLLWWSSVAMISGMVICLALSFIDVRLIAGVNIWGKPAKFFLSLVVQSFTLAWALSLVPEKLRGAKVASLIFVLAAWSEMAYIIFRASRGELSHFNTSSLTAAILYPLMGVGAVSLVATSMFVGWRIWQQRGANLMREAASVGLIFGGLLGLIAGAYLSSHTSHWIGGDQTDATGLGFFHWSTTGGDLRVAHFIGLHTAQALPLAALSGRRWIIYGAAILMTLVMFATFMMAVYGVPLLALGLTKP